MLRNVLKYTITAVLIAAPSCVWALDTSQYQNSGDTYFSSGDFTRALEQYSAGLALEKGNYEFLWKIARCYSRLTVSSTDKKIIKEYVLKQEEYSRKAVEAGPERFEGYRYLASALGKLLTHAPFDKVYKYINEIKETSETAIALNPDDPRCYIILGVWHRKVALAPWYQKTLISAFFGGLPGSDLETSVKLLEKAVQLENNRVKNYYELALSYRAVNDHGAAKQALEKAIHCIPRHDWDVKTLEKARKLLDNYSE